MARTILRAVAAVALSWAIGAGGGAPPAAAGDDAPTIRVTLGADGKVVLVLPDGSPKARGDLGGGTPEAQAAALDGVRDALRTATRPYEFRQPDGSSKFVLSIEPSAAAPWKYVQSVMQAAWGPLVKIRRLRFAAPGGGVAIEQVLPAPPVILHPGEVMQSDSEDVPTIRVSLLRRYDKDEGQPVTTIKMAKQEWRVAADATAEHRSQVLGAFCVRAAALRAATPGLTAEIDAPPPPGPRVPFADVFSVMEALRGAGIKEIQFEGLGTTPREAEPPTGGGVEEPPDPDRDVSAAAVGPAVDAALAWLAAHQSADGGWECAGFNQWCEGKMASGSGPAGLGKAIYDPGVTGLALLAFLGAGHTDRGTHPFAQVVQKGLRFLKSLQDTEGCFGPRVIGHFVYNHAIAALAMVKAYRITGNSRLYKGPAQKALDFVALARNPDFAWRYGVRPGENDTSVSGWMAMVLYDARLANDEAKKAGAAAPFIVDEGALDGLRAWLGKMTDPKSGRVGYIQRGTGPARPADLVDKFPSEKSEAMTAISVLLRSLLGEDPATVPALSRGAGLCAILPPVWNETDGSIDLYYWYYGAHAMFQVGGESWRLWEAATRTALLAHQRTGERCMYGGSWDPVDPWGPDGGRVYSTAMAVLCLKAADRYPRALPAK